MDNEQVMMLTAQVYELTNEVANVCTLLREINKKLDISNNNIEENK